MEITKYEHACFAVAKDGSRLLIDPGEWTGNIDDTDIAAAIITHGHADHISAPHIEKILRTNPAAMVYAPADIEIPCPADQLQCIEPGSSYDVAGFTLKFVGGQHADIAAGVPTPQNIAVMIDDSLYSPGDSFALPPSRVEILALPVAGPWMKFSEAADFLRAVKPTQAFPTHDAILSTAGKELADRMFGQVSEEIGTVYGRL